MTQKDKQLLLKDLCARLPYGIYANLPNHHLVSHKYIIHDINIQNGWTTGSLDCAGRIQVYSAEVEDIKPYLRPISSMTDEEFNSLKEETALNYNNQLDLVDWNNGCKTLEFWLKEIPSYVAILVFDWLNSHHFDFRNLIERGLAVDCTDLNVY